MTELSDKHARFVAEYLLDCNSTRAAIRVGYSPRTAGSTGPRLLAHPDVAAEIARRQAEVATTTKVTVTGLVSELERARVVAEAAENPSAMVAAVLGKARLCGYLVDRTEDVVERDRLERERAQAEEFKSAGELLAAAAISMGLPPSATPAQIVGASAERAIATPEVFALLRAVGEVR